jgi:hypothetical protein
MPPERDGRPDPTRRAILGTGASLAAAATIPGCAGPGRPEPSAAQTGRGDPDGGPRGPHADAVDRTLADLADRRGGVDPSRAGERAARRRRLGAALASRGIDALLREGGATMT